MTIRQVAAFEPMHDSIRLAGFERVSREQAEKELAELKQRKRPLFMAIDPAGGASIGGVEGDVYILDDPLLENILAWREKLLALEHPLTQVINRLTGKNPEAETFIIDSMQTRGWSTKFFED
jgi:hypothetical protein